MSNIPTIDTTGLETISALEPLVNPGTYLLSVLTIVPHVDEGLGKVYWLDITTKLEESGVINQEGGQVNPGKYLRGRIFTAAKDKGDGKYPSRLQQIARDIKLLLLALNNIPVDKDADAKFAALPVSKRTLEPYEQWTGVSVFGKVEIEKESTGKDGSTFPPKNNIKKFMAASTVKK
jgi:hypothetical protein